MPRLARPLGKRVMAGLCKMIGGGGSRPSRNVTVPFGPQVLQLGHFLPWIKVSFNHKVSAIS